MNQYLNARELTPCAILGVFLVLLSSLNMTATQTTQYVTTANYGYPFPWLVEVSGDGGAQVATSYYFQFIGFTVDFLFYALIAYLLISVIEYYGHTDNHLWDIIFLLLILCAILFKLHEPLMKSNILNDRPILESVFSFGDRPAFTNIGSMIENATPMKQKLIGVINVISDISSWVIGTFVATSLFAALAQKAGWKIFDD